MGWATEPKKSLTPNEVLIVANAALVSGVFQHHLAAMYGVDSGRIAEAVVAIRWAAENHRKVYRHIQIMKKRKLKLVVENKDDQLKLIQDTETAA